LLTVLVSAFLRCLTQVKLVVDDHGHVVEAGGLADQVLGGFDGAFGEDFFG